MSVSPYGLGYGLGVMANAIPTQMNQRANEDLMLQMNKMKLMESRRQMAQEHGLDEAARYVSDNPETESVAALSQANTPQGLGVGGNARGMSTEDTSSTIGIPGKPGEPASTVTLDHKGLNLPGASGIPNAPTDDQMAALKKPLATVQRAKVYTTPYQAAAHRFGAMSDYLFKQGLVEPAMRLQAQAGQAQEMHTQKIGQDAARLLSTGSPDALPLLKQLGMSDVVEVGKDKDGTAWLKHSNGSFTPIDYGDLAAIASDGKNLGAVFAKMNTADAQLYARQYTAQKRAESIQEQIKAKDKISTEQIKSKEKIADGQNKSRERMAQVRASAPKSASSADIIKVKAMMDDTGMSAKEAWDRVKPSLDARGAVTDKARLSALRARNSEIYKNLGEAPSAKDPDYAEYADNQARIEKLMKAPEKPVRTPVVAEPASIPTPTSKEEYDKLPSGSQYMKDGKRYIKG